MDATQTLIVSAIAIAYLLSAAYLSWTRYQHEKPNALALARIVCLSLFWPIAFLLFLLLCILEEYNDRWGKN